VSKTKKTDEGVNVEQLLDHLFPRADEQQEGEGVAAMDPNHNAELGEGIATLDAYHSAELGMHKMDVRSWKNWQLCLTACPISTTLMQVKLMWTRT
jgi:hypothetical protein